VNAPPGAAGVPCSPARTAATVPAGWSIIPDTGRHLTTLVAPERSHHHHHHHHHSSTEPDHVNYGAAAAPSSDALASIALSARPSVPSAVSTARSDHTGTHTHTRTQKSAPQSIVWERNFFLRPASRLGWILVEYIKRTDK
jgi:hypothetical protein